MGHTDRSYFSDAIDILKGLSGIHLFNIKFSLIRCLSPVMLVIVLLSAFPPAVQAALPANVLKWTKIDKPGIRNFTVVSPSEVSKIVVSKGNIIYAIDSYSPAVPPNPLPRRIYRSDNAGLSWTDLTPSLLDAGAVLNPGDPVDIAVSPDTPQVVAVVTNGGTKVFASMDNGASWIDAQVPALSTIPPPAETIQCITISGGYFVTFPAWDIAIGTAKWGNTTSDGNIWIRQIGGIDPGWHLQNVTVDSSHIGGEVSSIAFAQGRGYLVAVVSTGADVSSGPLPLIDYRNQTWFCIGQMNANRALPAAWNSFSGYPVAIINEGDAAGITIDTTLALPSDFSPSGQEITSRSTGASGCLPSGANEGRRAFVSVLRQPLPDAMNDVYRIDDTIAVPMKVGVTGDRDVRSIAYYGTVSSGTLLAGYVLPKTSSIEVDVRRCLNPFASSISWLSATRPPTGPGNAFVAWAIDGTGAFCGTGQASSSPLDESAFSRSTDLGDTWEQTSLIDTDINITDIAPSPDSQSLFMTSYSTRGIKGLWRTASDPLGAFWGRVLTSSDPSYLIIRLSPDYANDYTIYIAGVEGDKLYVSHDRGNHWKKQMLPSPMVDFVVAGRDTVYVALPGGKVRKTLNEGGYWYGNVTTGLTEINMITLSRNGHVFVASKDGRVAWSSNNGDTFTEIPEAIDIVGGDTQVVADAGYAKKQRHLRCL